LSANKSSSSFIYLNCGDLLLNESFLFTQAVSITLQRIPFSSGYLLLVRQQNTYEILHSNPKFRFMIPDYTVTFMSETPFSIMAVSAPLMAGIGI